MNKKLFSLFLVFVLNSACAPVQIAKKVDFVDNEIIEKSFDDTWNSVIELVSTKIKVPIKISEKASGLIQLEPAGDESTGLFSCKTGGLIQNLKSDILVNFFIKKVEEKKTRVTVITNKMCFYRLLGQVSSEQGFSTGVIERKYLDYLKNN